MMKKGTLRVGDLATTKMFSFRGVVIRVTKIYKGGGVDGVEVRRGGSTYTNSMMGRGWKMFERVYGFNDYYDEIWDKS